MLEPDKHIAELHRRQLNDYARLLDGVKEQKVGRKIIRYQCIYYFLIITCEQFLRNLDYGDHITESEKNAVVARKIGLAMPQVYKGS
jgi:hypothetical protein